MAFIQRLGQLRAPVSSYAALPLTNNVLGDVRISTDTGDAYTWMLEATSGSLTDWLKVTSSSYSDLIGGPNSSALDIDNAVKVVRGLAINIAYLGFQIMTEYGAAISRMFDGMVNKFTDETGIESTSNALYNRYLTNTDTFRYYQPDNGDLDLQTKLLIHGDGVQGSTSFVDLLRTKFINHGVITDTSVKKFGTGSLKFDGINDYIEFDTDDSLFVARLFDWLDVIYNPNSIAIDFWFYSNASGVQPIFANSAVSTLPNTSNPSFAEGESFLITKNSSNKIEVTIQHGLWDDILGQPVDAPLTVESTSVISNSTWVHVAVQKNQSGYLELYINGVLEATSSAFNTGAAMNTWPTQCNLYIGKNGSTYLNGYLDEIRVSYAIRYFETFTPMTEAYNSSVTPAPTPTIEDESSSAHTVVVYGNARMSGTNPLLGNASLYLDGIDSYLSLADSDDWQLCEEGGFDSYTKLLLHLDNNVTDEAGKTVTNNGVTFSSSEKKFGTHSALFNGSSTLTVSDSPDWDLTGDFTIDCWVKLTNITPAMGIADHQQDGENFWSLSLNLAGMADIWFSTQISGSTSVEVKASYTWLTNTWYHIALVRNGTGTNCFTFYVDGIALSTILNNGNWGGAVHSGSGDLQIGRYLGYPYYLNGYIDEFRISKGIARWTSNFTPPEGPYGQSLSDYTIDLWVDPLALDDLNTYIIGQDDSWKLTLDGTSNKYLKYTIIDGESVIAPLALNLESWNHLAIVQKNGTLKLYVNGILGASIEGSAIVNGTENLTIGADSNGEHLFNGFIEEVRISDNARWSATFTPPSVEYDSDSNTKLLLPLNVQTVPNMVLQSVGYVSNYVPTSARVVIFEEDIDVMEPNVDLVIEVSRDGGTTFTTCLIAKDQEFGDGTLNLFTGSVDLQSQPNGELLVWRLTTQNNKDCRVRGLSLNWR